MNAVLNDPITLTASWKGTYYWPNNGGATTRSVTVNNTAAGTFAYPVTDAASGSCMQDVFTVTVSAPLPVTLRFFNATLNKDKVLLEWGTSQENNNKYFTIEKSNDGINFHYLGKVYGAGNSTVNHNYQLVDNIPWEGNNYYRLNQTDMDGNTKNYEIRNVKYKSSKNFSAGIINKEKGHVSVIIQSAKAARLRMKIVDLGGKEILQETFSVNSGGLIKDIYLNNGLYILLLSNDVGEMKSYKIIVR